MKKKRLFNVKEEYEQVKKLRDAINTLFDFEQGGFDSEIIAECYKDMCFSSTAFEDDSDYTCLCEMLQGAEITLKRLLENKKKE